jgi:hypothetical protein
MARAGGLDDVVPQEDLERLAELLKGEGLAAQYGERPTFRGSWTSAEEDI